LRYRENLSNQECYLCSKEKVSRYYCVEHSSRRRKASNYKHYCKFTTNFF